MTRHIEAASHALAEADRRPSNTAMPAMCGCPGCRSMRMIASPAPLGTCPDCGAALEVIPMSLVAAAVLAAVDAAA